MTDEKIIRAHDSGRRPFVTPDGYFEGFTERLMQRLPEREDIVQDNPVSVSVPHKATIMALTPMRRFMRYAAAIIVMVGCIGGGLYLFNRNPATSAVTASAEDMVTDENLDEILDYEMLSNNQIAYYLTEAY